MSTVEDEYEFDEDMIYSMIDEDDTSGFWSSSYDFYCSIKEDDIESLSKKQLNWLDKITEALEEKNIL